MTKLDKTFQKDQILTAGELNLLVKKINEIIDYINSSNQNNNNNPGVDNTIQVDYYTTCELLRTGPNTFEVRITLGDNLYNEFKGKTVSIYAEGTTNMNVADDADRVDKGINVGWTLCGSTFVNITSSNQITVQFNRRDEKTKYRFMIQPRGGGNPSAVTNTIIVAKKGMDLIDDDAPLILPE